MDKLPPLLRISVKTILTILCIFLMVLGVFWVPSAIIQLIIFRSWKRKHINEFSAYIQGLPDLDEVKKNLYIKNPEYASRAMWDKFTGTKPRYGKGSILPFSDWTEALALGPLGLLLGVAATVYAATNVVDLFAYISSRVAT